MALPWLIGAAVVAIGAAIASSSDDDTTPDYDAEARRRAELERERVEKERKEKRQAARENFALHGERIGSDIAQSLQGWIEIKHDKAPAFTAQLTTSGYKIESNDVEMADIEAIVPETGELFDAIRNNLKAYSNLYAVTLIQGPKLTEAQDEVDKIDIELQQIAQLKAEISKIREKISKNA